ncbi:MAG: TRAP transporter substrate-binding protein DctP [bacterium]|nr:TRAP transporter substrate-binding protein DctP [bacterium]
MKRIFLFALLLCAMASNAFAQTEIKFASLAPDGSTWMKTMRALGKEVSEKTGGKVTFKFYPGGVQGDEVDILRKIRIGQLHAGGFTGNGIGEILPAARVLEVPFLFHTEEELDAAVAAVQADLERGFEEKGFVLLGWSDVGFVHFFSKDRIQTSKDLMGKKVWMWQGDPLARSLFQSFGITPIPLSVQDVMTSLQTGMVDVVYASPLAAIALQWQTRTKYVTEQPVTYASGAVLLSKTAYNKLTADQQRILKSVAAKQLRDLTVQTRKDNDAAFATLKASGLTVTPFPSDAELGKMEAIGMKTRTQLTGTLYSKDLINRVETAVSKYRESE